MASISPIPDIPLVDFEPFLNGRLHDRERVAAFVDAGLSSTGFIYLGNHGIDQQKIDECFSWSRRFFAISDSEKKLVQRSRDSFRDRGYSELGSEKVRGRQCMKEGFTCGNPKNEAQPNIWPSEDAFPGFRTLMEGFFELAVYVPCSISDLLHYPALPTRLLRSGALARNPAHSDLGTLTLLFQDDVGGLEIADLGSASTDKSAEFEKHGRFNPVKPIAGTVVVNVGYLLMRWSNGRWRNTIHRVVDSPSVLSEGELRDQESDDGMSPARYSIPFVAHPDPETVVQALPGCWSEEVPKRWKPLDAGKYLRRKLESTYA